MCVCVNVVTVRIKPSLGALQRKNSKSEITMELGSGWVGPGLTWNLFFGKSSQNRPKIVFGVVTMCILSVC